MSEKREPGQFYLVRFKYEDGWTIAETWFHPVRHALRLRTTDGTEAGFHMVEQWGPRILPDPNLAQVPREELRWLRELHDAARNENHERLCDALDRLDSLRRREGESDG